MIDPRQTVATETNEAGLVGEWPDAERSRLPSMDRCLSVVEEFVAVAITGIAVSQDSWQLNMADGLSALAALKGFNMFDVRLPFQNALWASLVVFELFVCLQAVSAQTNRTPLPKFEDFPVPDVFDDTPHPPILITPEQRLFRTRIREGVAKGWGVWVDGEWAKEQNRPGPNFAGHYIIIVWGCGSGCIRMAMTDAETGTVFMPPISEGGFALPMLVFPDSAGRAADFQYRKDSRLMIVRTTPHADRPSALPYAFYYLWEGRHWTLLRQIRIERLDKE